MIKPIANTMKTSTTIVSELMNISYFAKREFAHEIQSTQANRYLPLLLRVVRDYAGFGGSLAGWRAIVLMRGDRQRVTPEISASPLNGDITYCLLDGVWQSSKGRLSSRRFVISSDLSLEPANSRIRLIRLLEVSSGFW